MDGLMQAVPESESATPRTPKTQRIHRALDADGESGLFFEYHHCSIDLHALILFSSVQKTLIC
jgi:hypothetical protein